MNLLCKNISLNLSRDLINNYVLFSYICNICIRAIHNSCKIPFHLLVNSGGWFFYLWFRVSESGLRYAHKIPFFSTSQDKNSIPENSHNCKQCPKPDNLRPKKPFYRFFRGSLVWNNSLTLGRLVSIVRVNAGLETSKVFLGRRGCVKKRNYENI